MPRALINPAAGTGNAASAIDMLARHGVDVVTPKSAGDVARLAREAAAAGDDRLIVVGGDGTLHHAIRGLAGTACALAVIPVGTGNDLARAVGLDLDPVTAARRALFGRPRRIDLGKFGHTPFLGVAAAGFVGNVLDWIEARGAKRLGPGSYAWAVVRSLVGFRPSHIRVEYDGGCFCGRVTMVGIANSPIFGGGMRIAPQAALDDGWLDLVIVEAMSRPRMLTAFPRIYRGSHVALPGVRCLPVRGATITADPALNVYGDGEAMGRTGSDAHVEVWPGALQVIV